MVIRTVRGPTSKASQLHGIVTGSEGVGARLRVSTNCGFGKLSQLILDHGLAQIPVLQGLFRDLQLGQVSHYSIKHGTLLRHQFGPSAEVSK